MCNRETTPPQAVADARQTCERVHLRMKLLLEKARASRATAALATVLIVSGCAIDASQGTQPVSVADAAQLPTIFCDGDAPTCDWHDGTVELAACADPYAQPVCWQGRMACMRSLVNDPEIPDGSKGELDTVVGIAFCGAEYDQ